MRKLGTTFSGLLKPAFLSAVLAISHSWADAARFQGCSIPAELVASDEASRIACDAEKSVFATWEDRLQKIEAAQQELEKTLAAKNWPSYKATWGAVLQPLKAIEADAAKNPQAIGSAQIAGLFGQELGFFFQNAGLSSASSLDDASQKIQVALDGNNGTQAATIGVNLLRQASMRGTEFARGLAQQEGSDARKRFQESLNAKGEERRAEMLGSSSAGYANGFGTRIGMFGSIVIQWTVIATILAAIFGFGAKRPRVVVKMPLIALAVLIPVWLLHIVVPFIPGWLQFVVAFMVGVWLWGRTEKLPAPWAQIFHTSQTGRPSAVDFVGGMFRAFAAGKGATSAPPVGASEVIADGKNTHGSARWGTAEEIKAAGHLMPKEKASGFALARVQDAPPGIDQRFRFVGHVVTVAPTGSGKGIGAVIPHLLDYPGSCLVLDVKGENAAVTARARRQMGHQVFIVDPFGVTKGETHSFNLLDRIDPSDPECVSESATLADCLVVVDSKGGGEHFDESAKTLLQGLMLHVASNPDQALRNLGELRRLLTADEDTFLGLLADMASDESAAFGIPARAANTLMGMADRERGSVLSTARRNTAFLDDPRIAACLARTDFNLSNIKTELMTVYLVLPANKIGPNARFVRGFIGAVIGAITASATQPRHRVAFILDEFGQLGYMKAIEDAVSLLRGYGLSFWVFIQDLSQLKGVYPKWQTFLANSAKTFYGTDDYDTAKYVSDSLGQSTIEFETHNEGKNKGSSLSGGGGSMNSGKSAGTSQQFTGRHLLTPDEVMRLGPERPIVLVKGEYPYQLTRLNYLTDHEYVGLADPNPYHA
jgi:type IV secretion system protein VirD4